MKLGGKEGIISEGKLLEVIPVIETPMGMSLMLPPVIWPVANELLGYQEYHVQGTPYTLWTQERMQIPGTNSAASHRLSFMIRIMEDSPKNDPTLGTRMAAEDVRAIIDAIHSRK